MKLKVIMKSKWIIPGFLFYVFKFMCSHNLKPKKLQMPRPHFDAHEAQKGKRFLKTASLALCSTNLQFLDKLKEVVHTN